VFCSYVNRYPPRSGAQFGKPFFDSASFEPAPISMEDKERLGKNINGMPEAIFIPKFTILST
jgi:hypothetical protein